MCKYFYSFNTSLFFGLVLCCFLWASCEKDDEQIRSELRNIVRKEVGKRNVAIRPELDSLCKLNRNYTVRQAVDSIYKIRLDEIRKIAEQ